MPFLLYSSHNLVASIALFTILLPAVWLGRELTSTFFNGPSKFEAWCLGTTFGIGIIAAASFIFGILGILRPSVIWPLFLSILLTLLIGARKQLRSDTIAAARWLAQPIKREPAYLFLAGIGLAFFWLNFIGALAPEIRSDSTRQRLVTAVYFANRGEIASTPPELDVAAAPALGEITYALIVATGTEQSAKLFHFLAGLFCTMSIFAIGRRLGGQHVGYLAAAFFYLTWIVAFLSQTAYLDLFTTLFAVTAAQIFLICKITDWQTVIAGGICIGLGVAVKVHFGYIAVGLALMAVILMLGQVSPRRGFLLTATLIVATVLTSGPWLARSYSLTGLVPGMQLSAMALSNNAKALGDLPEFGYGRSIMNFLSIPFTVTFLSGRFGGAQTPPLMTGGHIGYLIVGILPLLLVKRQQQLCIALFIGSLGASLLWFNTAQYLRYGLPILGLLAPVSAVAYISAWCNAGTKYKRAVLNGLLCCLVMLGSLVRMQLPDMSHAFAFG